MFTSKSIRIFQFVTIFLAFSSYQFTSAKAVSNNETISNSINEPAKHKPNQTGISMKNKSQTMINGSQVCSQGFGQHRTPKSGNLSIKAEVEVSQPCQTKKGVFMCSNSSCHSKDKKPHVSAIGCEGASGPTKCLSYAFKPHIPKQSFESSPIPIQSSKASHPIRRRAVPEKKEQTLVIKPPLECVTTSNPSKILGCQKLESVMECTKCETLSD
ncbi:secreted protein [Melampsora americana]|nr:secreted protein [Melampsora americana]